MKRGDTGRLYQTFPVCALCYELYQREVKLRAAEAQFSETMQTAAEGAFVKRNAERRGPSAADIAMAGKHV